MKVRSFQPAHCIGQYDIEDAVLLGDPDAVAFIEAYAELDRLKIVVEDPE